METGKGKPDEVDIAEMNLRQRMEHFGQRIKQEIAPQARPPAKQEVGPTTSARATMPATSSSGTRNYGLNVDLKHMEQEWDSHTSRSGRPPLAGSPDD